MRLTITQMDGGHFELEGVEPHTTVAQLRSLIQGPSGVPAAEQRLKGPGCVLDDDARELSHYGLRSGSAVSLVHGVPPPTPVQPAPVQILFKTHDGITKTYQVCLDDTVTRFKEMVRRNEAVPIEQQWFTFNSRKLEDHQTLGYYGIEANSMIYQNLRLRGG